LGDFDYVLFDTEEKKEIEYMLKGHSVEVPVTFIESITLTREELYD